MLTAAPVREKIYNPPHFPCIEKELMPLSLVYVRPGNALGVSGRSSTLYYPVGFLTLPPAGSMFLPGIQRRTLGLKWKVLCIITACQYEGAEAAY